MNPQTSEYNLTDEIYPVNCVSIISDTSPIAKKITEVMAPLLMGEPNINPNGYLIQSGATNLEIMEKAVSHPGTIILNITTAINLIRTIEEYEYLSTANLVNPKLNPITIIINRNHLAYVSTLFEKIYPFCLIPFTSESEKLFVLNLLAKIKADQEEIRKYLAEPPKRIEPTEDEAFQHMLILGEIKIDNIVLDLTQANIKMPHHKKPVQLTPTEIKMMTYFLEHRGRLLRYNILSEVLNGPGTRATNNHISQIIFRLRRKVEPDKENPKHLVTIRGHGLRFKTKPDE